MRNPVLQSDDVVPSKGESEIKTEGRKGKKSRRVKKKRKEEGREGERDRKEGSRKIETGVKGQPEGARLPSPRRRPAENTP